MHYTKMDYLQLILLVTIVKLVIISNKGCESTISCFICSSRNGSERSCEDPFHPGPLSYAEKCRVPKRGHKGEFPANFCIKVTAVSASTNEKLVIRRCVLGNMDNQCGKFTLDNDTLHGCILTCDLDGCNTSVSQKSNSLLTFGLMIVATLFTFPIIDSISGFFSYLFSLQNHQRKTSRTITSFLGSFYTTIAPVL